MQGLNGKVFSILGAEQNALEIARFVLRNQGVAKIVLPSLSEDKHEHVRSIFEGLQVECVELRCRQWSLRNYFLG
jgi:cystathionine beta-lyase/cystathionine gamma-synthase